MHFYTLHELKRMHLCGKQALCRVVPEQEVLLNASRRRRQKKPQAGRFDFLVECKNGKYLGIEVLTRPSKGKMLEKLRYAEQVDEFVFVLPSNAMLLYQKPRTKVFHKKHRGNALPKEFADKKLIAWMFDLNEKKFVEKDRMGRVFECEK